MKNAKDMLEIDAHTWVPVAFFSMIEKDDGTTELCQLWVNPLGNCDWRKIETRNIKEMTRVYAECTTFEPDPADERD